MTKQDPNKHWLKRAIPAGVKREVRSACGFGCVLCGTALYHYDHFDPEFADALTHDPQRIALLCGKHHDEKTRGFLSPRRVATGRASPYSMQHGRSTLTLDIGRDDRLSVTIGRTRIVGSTSIVQIDGVDILRVDPPEEAGGVPRLSAKFFDDRGTAVAEVFENEWMGSPDAFDIETTGGRFKIRSRKGRVDPPSGILVERIELSYNDKRISGSLERGFSFFSGGAEIALPSHEMELLDAPFGLRLSDDGVAIGQTESHGWTDRGAFVATPSAMKATGVKVEMDAVDGPFPGTKAMRVSGFGGDGPQAVTFAFRRPPQNTIHPVHRTIASPRRKIGRNADCPCGSGKKNKKCHNLR